MLTGMAPRRMSIENAELVFTEDREAAALTLFAGG